MPYAWFFGRKDDDKYEGFEASVDFLRDVMKKQVNFFLEKKKVFFFSTTELRVHRLTYRNHKGTLWWCIWLLARSSHGRALVCYVREPIGFTWIDTGGLWPSSILVCHYLCRVCFTSYSSQAPIRKDYPDTKPPYHWRVGYLGSTRANDGPGWMLQQARYIPTCWRVSCVGLTLERVDLSVFY